MTRKKLAIEKKHFFLRESGRYRQIDILSIRYIEAHKNYCVIDTVEKVWNARTGIGKLEKILPPGDFCRIHRAFIVGLAHIEWFDKHLARVSGRNLPIGENYRCELPRRVLLLPPVASGIRVPAAEKSVAPQ